VDLLVLGKHCKGNPAQGVCDGLAKLYHEAVDELAEGAFSISQEEAAAHEAECQT
jgi:hypothetical protein